MEFKGTPGKWVLHKNAFACVVSDESSLLVSNCGGRTSNVNADELYIEQQANALLISKAPEMLEMVQTLSNLMKEDVFLHDTSIKQWFYNTVIEVDELIKEATEL